MEEEKERKRLTGREHLTEDFYGDFAEEGWSCFPGEGSRLARCDG
jgi:hypothetical protein